MEIDSVDDVENVPLAKGKGGKGAKAATLPAPAQQPLAPIQANAGKSIEEMYQKKTQLEHIILRPDTYIGSTERQPFCIWVHNGQKMEYKSVSYPPGLYKIFDEILVNAADNKVRDATMDTIKVDVDTATNTIRVWNNGKGIPVEMHKEEGVYVPELIFGHLLTSSNYNDNEKKITGGRNGYGAKLANIFSSEFTVETCDGSRQRRYKQTFTHNMTKKGQPKITDCKASDNWTCITFKPDLAKFGMTELDDDIVSVLRRRVYDMAAVLGKGAKVYYNGERLPIKSFQEYVDLYLGPKENGVPRFCERFSDRWEVCISLTDGSAQQVSFVNAIATTKGGTHVDYIVNQFVKHAVEKLSKKTSKTAAIKPAMVRNHLWVFINCYVENPAFDSQTKETLTLRSTAFGSKCELPTPFMDKVLKAGLSDSIIKFAEFKSQKDLKKGDGSKRSRLTGIGKLADANDAGGPRSNQCTLILTEGDSAKTLAISGLGVVGRDQYGVFPLRGKLLNVREASAAQIAANAEIQHIKQIMGLQHGKVYENTSSLRYGHLMIMTDQDHDGSHIKGLIMNFLHSFFPSLLRIPGFLLEFITPIVKARRGREVKAFYTIPEYEAWKESLDHNLRGWDIKYYKGLGTSTQEEAREYFSRLDQHRKEFVWAGDQDGDAIELAFSKKRIDDRKEWLSNYVPGTFLDQSVNKISYEDFINRELILFSRADLERSIPSMLDGLKPGQRKILYACFKRNLKKDIKVAQLSAYVAEHSAYHHGEASLASAIINLAQDFVGANNINLLHPSGQFGTRLQGGKDAASPRYIFTRLSAMTRQLFNENDDVLLNYLNEEGQSIEPEWYMPIIPTVLVNGAEGIGTGWSTSIPNYNPRDIIANLRRLLNGEEQVPIHPWYRGFNGSMMEVPHKSGQRSYVVSGIITQTGPNTVEITELPLHKWTQDYKEFLEELMKPQEKEGALVADYREHHSDSNVHFVVELLPGKMEELLASPGGLEAKFKLTTKIATSNMMLFNKDGLIKQYQNPEQIISEFYGLRLEYYEKRRIAMLRAAQQDQSRCDNKVRFIMAVVNGELEVRNRKRSEIEKDLDRMGFDRLGKASAKARAADAPAEGDDEEGNEQAATTSSGASGTPVGSYDYLLSMSIYSLTKEKIAALREEAAKAAQRVEYLATITGKEMWELDLDAFEKDYGVWEAEDIARMEEARREQQAAKKNGRGGKGAAGKGRAPAGGRKKGKKAGSDEDDDNDSGSGSDWEEERKKAPAPRAAPAAKPKPAAAAPAAPAAAPALVQTKLTSLITAAKPAAAPPPASAAAPAPAAAKPAAAGKPPARKAVAAGRRRAVVSSDEEEDMDVSESEGKPSDDDFDADEDFEEKKPAKKAPAKRAPAAAKSAAPAEASAPAAAAPRAAPKAAGGRAKKPAPLPSNSQDSAQPSQEDSVRMDPANMSLAERLAGQMKATLNLSGKAATAVNLVDDEVNSPAPMVKTAVGAKKPAAGGRGKKPEGGAAKNPAAKRKGAAAKKDSDEELSAESSEGEEETFELSAPSPAVAPKGKKGRVGPSPLGIKSMARTAGGVAATAAMAPVPEERPQRARRAAATKPPQYVISDDSEGGNSDSEFEILSD